MWQRLRLRQSISTGSIGNITISDGISISISVGIRIKVSAPVPVLEQRSPASASMSAFVVLLTPASKSMVALLY
jgi:hypothetical protein